MLFSIVFPLVALFVLAFAVLPAAAQDLKNVKNLNASLLAGKTCKSTFDTGGSAQNSRGAVHASFFIEGGALAARFKRKPGPEAYEKFHESDMGFDDLGTVLDLEVDGQTVKFTNKDYAKYTLALGGGKLIGEVDPTAHPARRNWARAKVELDCALRSAP